MYSLQSWRHYLEGCSGGVKVATNHEPLAYLMDQQVLTRVQMRWLRLELFQSIVPTIKYQPEKANVVTDVVRKSQRKSKIDSMDYLVVGTTIKEQVLALSGIIVELTVEDLQKWTTTYNQDKGHVAAFTKLC